MKILNQEQKQQIIGKRYNYYDYDEELIRNIAKKKIIDVDFKEASTLVQAMNPNKLICSGLFDCFLVFECRNGLRTDPPQKAYHNLKDKKLVKEIFDFFKDNNIKYHESWNLLKEVLLENNKKGQGE